MKERLDTRQRDAAARFMEHADKERDHLVVSLSGAHAYGFPSPDSDVDLKAVHVERSEALLGLFPPVSSVDALVDQDGVEVDYSSNELRPVLVGVLQGNGNYVERLLSPSVWSSAPELEGLRPLVRKVLSRRLHRHYRGFAMSQWKSFRLDGATAKRALYVFRTALTGIHVLTTGQVVVDVTALLGEYGFAAAMELVERKKAGEQAVLQPGEVDRWMEQLEKVLHQLDECERTSVLPEEPPPPDEINAWLLDLRRRGLAR